MNDLEFLRQFMAKLQAKYELASELTEADFYHNREPSESNKKNELERDELERVARIADQLGFDGNLLLNLFPDNSDGWLTRANRKMMRQIEALSRIIAKLGVPAIDHRVETSDLTASESDILESIGDDVLRGQQIADKAGYSYDAARRHLSAMVKRGYLISTRKGYKRVR